MSDGQTFTPKHLAILRWFKSVGREWVSLRRAERDCRINGQKLALAEELLELTAQPASTEPLLKLHRSGKHYQITARGLEACDKYTTKEQVIDLGGGKTRTVEVVVLASTGMRPKAEIVGDDEPPMDDDDDDLPAGLETDDRANGRREDEADAEDDVILEETEPARAEPTAEPSPKKKRSLPKK